MNYVLSDATFTQLAEYIKEQTGIHIPPTKKYLIENRLVKILEESNLKSYDEYLYLLRYSRNGREVERLFDAITTNETFFFREPMQFDVLMDRVVPRMLDARGARAGGPMRIWSAACSSGEEAYTIAMLLKEKRAALRAEIMATDISNKVLDAARRAVYSSYSVRNVPRPYLDRYFRAQGQEFALDPVIRSAVRFKSFNLLDDRRTMEMSGFDIIFCRNVLIYFDVKTKQQVVSQIYDSLKPGGFLFIGSSESLHNVTRAFKPVTVDKVIVYEKV